MTIKTLEPGGAAPAFSLPDQNGKQVSLADFAGKWLVLYFYPRDDTPDCTTEACGFTAGIKAMEDMNASVLGVSVDSADSHRKFIAKYNLAFSLLSDPSHEVMACYGVWDADGSDSRSILGVIRSTVIIAPDGTVAHHWPTVNANGHAEEVQAKLAELQE